MVLEKWRVYVFVYMVWLMLFAGVEGAGRKACNKPMEKWIQAGATVRERSLRTWFRDRANECLEYTPWYAYSRGTLFTIALLAPFGVAWSVRRNVIRLAVFVAAMTMMLASMAGVRWLYDWMG
jgi:hypothetical protein